MDFVSERTIDGKPVVLVEEILDSVDAKKLELLLKSGALQTFTRKPAGHVEPGTDEATEIVIYNQNSNLSDDQWRRLFDWPESLHPVPYYDGRGYEGLFVLTSEVKSLLHMDAEPSHDRVEKALEADLERLWNAIKPGNQKAVTLKKAVAFLEENPQSTLSSKDFSAETFGRTEKPKRDVGARILKAALKRLSET